MVETEFVVNEETHSLLKKASLEVHTPEKGSWDHFVSKITYKMDTKEATEKLEDDARSGDGEGHLKKVLTTFDLTMFGVGSIIGAGIFTIIGKAVQEAGPSLIFSFIAAAICCSFIAFAYAELSTAHPLAGGAYAFAYAVFGELTAWVVAWNILLELTIGGAIIARCWSSYMTSLLLSIGINPPPIFGQWQLSFLPDFFELDVPAGILLLTLMCILLFGVKESMRLLITMVIFKVSILCFFVIYGADQIDSANYQDPFINGPSGMFKGAALVFFAYLGFDSISNMVEDAKEPHKTIPAAIFSSLAICTVIYISVTVVLVGVVPIGNISVEDPLASAFSNPRAKALIALAAVSGIMTTLLTSLMSEARIIFSMSRDNLLPPSIAYIAPGSSTPWRALCLSAIPASMLAFIIPTEFLDDLTSVGVSSAFIMVSAAILQTRYSPAHGAGEIASLTLGFIAVSVCTSLAAYAEWWNTVIIFSGILFALILYYCLLTPTRPECMYICPMVPVIPLCGIMFTVHIILGQGHQAFLVYGIWVLIGLCIYFNYGYYKAGPEVYKRKKSMISESA